MKCDFFLRKNLAMWGACVYICTKYSFDLVFCLKKG